MEADAGVFERGGGRRFDNARAQKTFVSERIRQNLRLDRFDETDIEYYADFHTARAWIGLKKDLV